MIINKNSGKVVEMSKLIKPIEYATLQGISRQAVYAKIKKGTLDSKTVDGKMYIVMDDVEIKEEGSTDSEEEIPGHLVDVKELLSSKDQTISVLKESISDLKHTNTEINTTLRGEIELLKQVFTEMRNLYVKQVDYMVVDKQKELAQYTSTSIETSSLEERGEQEDECWITLEEFFERCNISKEKRKAKVLKRLRKAFRRNDERIKMQNEDIYLSCYHFYEDILS
jgi:predicted DNA-binding transcriptional regulator AlpA